MISYTRTRTRARQDLRDKSARGFRPRPCVHMPSPSVQCALSIFFPLEMSQFAEFC